MSHRIPPYWEILNADEDGGYHEWPTCEDCGAELMRTADGDWMCVLCESKGDNP